MVEREYIDRGSALSDLDNGWFPQSMEYTRGVEIARDIIKSLPTADVVEVVRCKDCIHYYELEPVCLKIYSDGNVSADAWQERKPDDFCSYGERKDGKGETDG